MFISVAICTWNRSALLRQTLDQMHALQIPRDVSWELLVVNNNCPDDTSSVVASFAKHLPVKELLETKLGLAHARNCAVRAARGDYILWTDDDVLVQPDWLAAYVEAIKQWPQADYFGGSVDPLFAVEPPAWMRRNLDLLEGVFAIRDLGPETRPLAMHEMPFGANMLIRTDMHHAMPFDAKLGRRGVALIHGDETELFRALKRMGRLGVWVGGARVQHYIPAQRLTLAYVWKFFQGGGRTFIRQGDNPSWRSWGGVPRWALRQCVTASAKALLLAPFRSRAWLGAMRDTAKSLGTIQESRIQFLRARR
jgi:glycosyltransferase involved in cell wall biosynthesis